MIDELKPYAAYKDSALSWLGTIPSHWAEKRAKYLFHEVDERSKTGAEELLSVSHITGVTPRSQKKVTMFMAESTVGYKTCRQGDLVINTMWAWMGALGISPLAGLVSPAYGVYRPSQTTPLSSEFTGHLLRSPQYVSEYVCRSTGIQSSRLRLYPEQLLRIPVICPPPGEQRLILRFIAYAERRIRRYVGIKKKLIALLNEQKQAIIHRAVTRGLDPNVRLKPSGVEWLGVIPEHWKLLRLKDLSPRISGRLVYQPAQYFSEDGIPFIMGNNVTPDGIRWSGVKRIPREINDRFAHHALCEGDVITVRVGAPGVTCVVPRDANGLNCGSLMIIRRGARFNSKWLAYTMNSTVIRTQIALVQYGAAQEQINIEDATNFLLPVPPLEEQERIERMLLLSTEPFARAAERTARSIALIREYRSRLIADVVTGKLDVREAAARLPDETDDPEPLSDADAMADGDEATDDVDLATVSEDAET